MSCLSYLPKFYSNFYFIVLCVEKKLFNIFFNCLDATNVAEISKLSTTDLKTITHKFMGNIYLLHTLTKINT